MEIFCTLQFAINSTSVIYQKKSYQHCKTIICKSFNNYCSLCVFYAHPLPPPPSHHHHSFIHSFIYISSIFECASKEARKRKRKKIYESKHGGLWSLGNFNLKHASQIMNEYNKLCMHASAS